MATLVLSAAGAAVGGSFGGSLFGLSSLVLGKAVGATLGSMIDQKLLGAGAAPVEAGRVDRLRVMGSSEGAALPRCFGRMRVPGQLIWSSRFLEAASVERVGGKGGRGRQQTVTRFSYSISIALALCEGEVMRVGRIWADGQPLAQAGLTWRLHRGSEGQLPDPLIAAIEGADRAPAYRGTAYVVIEDLDLAPFGNRIPQLNFEVFRRPAPASGDLPRPAALEVRAVALVPGTGEYALATEPVTIEHDRGAAVVANVNNDRGLPDLVASLEQLDAELPTCAAISLVVSWFGDDLRAGRCAIFPAVEQRERDGDPVPWSVSGLARDQARRVSMLEDRPLFGGTPADATVVQAIAHMRAAGKAVMFYPFVLMDILPGNGRPNPWAPETEQPAVPWRGRITLERAPGVAGSADRTAAAAAEVDAFFGQAAASDFTRSGGRVHYSGPPEWSYRRFILHYAHLCALAGGVDAFCVGSELRSLTQIRDGAASYPAVAALRRLAGEVRDILGPATRIGYAADWSEYFGHQPADGSGDAIFHLDPLWADPAIDFVGIDNYMPLSDWRDGTEHADAAAGSIYDLAYLEANVSGGEGYDWYYPDAADREAQLRAPIEDGAHGEPWVFRYKDILNWWSLPHFNRIGGIRMAAPTPWQPGSKPVWFTELGCPAIDKGTNQPNVFSDPKSTESFFPYFSGGQRDDFIQQRYLQAVHRFWSDPANNPLSNVYGGRMVDMSRAYVWAWDARPWPDFPARTDTWVDGANHERGHWLNGRVAAPSLAEVVAEICERSGLGGLALDALHGCVTGYCVQGVETARQSLQPLALAYGFDSFARGGQVAFASRHGRVSGRLSEDALVAVGGAPRLARVRAPQSESVGRVALTFVRADLDYQAGAAEAIAPDVAEPSVSESSLPLVLSLGEAGAVARRWLAEARVARETVTFALPPSLLHITAGDAIELDTGHGRRILRVDRIEDAGHRTVTAVRTEPGVYERRAFVDDPVAPAALSAPSRVHAELLDLPLLTGDELPHAPHVAVVKRPWAGPVAVYAAPDDFGYALNRVVDRPATTGRLLDPLPAARPAAWMGWGGRLRLDAGALQSRSPGEVLNGANAAALRAPGSLHWEVVQFASAELVAPLTYRLDALLRGQAGTDGLRLGALAAGTDFVLLDGSLVQLDLPAAARGLDRHFRIGPATVGYDHPSYRHLVARFEGAGLRPYSPVHLRARRLPGGELEFRWIRRTRIDGDGWAGFDVPIGEERLRYEVQIRSAGTVLRTAATETETFLYPVAAQLADAAGAPSSFAVAQVSDRFGPGPFVEVALPA